MFKPHLRLEALQTNIRQAFDFSAEVSALLSQHHPSSVPISGPQIAIAMASFLLSLEHREAVMLLLAEGARSSAAVMVRPMFEAYYRGIWALKVANSEQIQDILGSCPRVPKLDTILQQLRQKGETALAEYNAWKRGGDYVHSGPLQLSRWLSHNTIEPHHPDSDVLDMLELSDFCGLLAGIAINQACGREAPELLSKLTEHSLRRIAQSAVEAYYESNDASRCEIAKLATVLAKIAKNRTKEG